MVESPDRFARDLMVQLAGHDMLRARGMTLIAASAPMHFVEDSPPPSWCGRSSAPSPSSRRRPSSANLAAARRRKRIATGEKVEGRKSHAEARPVKLAKALVRKKPKGGKLSLRAISASLAEQGHLNERGKPFNPKSAVMLGGERSRELTGRTRCWGRPFPHVFAPHLPPRQTNIAVKTKWRCPWAILFAPMTTIADPSMASALPMLFVGRSAEARYKEMLGQRSHAPRLIGRQFLATSV
jgi:hypothetical protein